MIANARCEALKVLAELCELSPEVRLGQLLAHLGFLGEEQTARNLWEIEDDELLSVLNHHRDELTEREQDTPIKLLQPAAAR